MNVPTLSLLFLLAALASTPSSSARADSPAFELVALGVYGGEVESNSSCYLLGEAGSSRFPLMIDGGSPVAGAIRWKGLDDASPDRQIQGAIMALREVEAVLLTHSHLDHLYGLILHSPLRFQRLWGYTSPTRILGNAHTISVLDEDVFSGRLWAPFQGGEAPRFRLETLPGLQPRAVAGMKVESIPLNHPVPSSAFLVTHPSGGRYLHLGDTGRSRAVWKRARPLLRVGALRAVYIEASFRSAQESLAEATGHLTPASLLAELGRLTGALPRSMDSPETLDSDSARRAAVRQLVPALGDCKILVGHIKPSDHSAVLDELRHLAGAGLPLVVLEQGQSYQF